jgi:hypothetical protein
MAYTLAFAIQQCGRVGDRGSSERTLTRTALEVNTFPVTIPRALEDEVVSACKRSLRMPESTLKTVNFYKYFRSVKAPSEATLGQLGQPLYIRSTRSTALHS